MNMNMTLMYMTEKDDMESQNLMTSSLQCVHIHGWISLIRVMRKYIHSVLYDRSPMAVVVRIKRFLI